MTAMAERDLLAGITVLEYATMVAGPYCGKLLAELGARVIKVEGPGGGDPARRRGPFPEDLPDDELSGLFLYLNTSKQGVTLNLETATGRDLFRRLAASADVLVEDATPGVMAAIGLDHDALCSLNPRLVYTSVTPFGQTGPYSQYRAYPMNLFHAGGEGYTLPGSLSNELFPGREPVQGGTYLAEYDGGLHAAIATVAALIARNLTGSGQHVDVSKQEAAMMLNLLNIQLFANTGELVTRRRSYHFGGIFPCKDGYVILYPREDRHWQGLTAAMGRPELGTEERFRTWEDRYRHRDEVNAVLREWVAAHTKEEVFQTAAPSGCPAAYFATTEDVFHSPQFAARDFFEEIEHPSAGRLAYPSRPYGFSEAPRSQQGPAPLLGQHNREVYCGLLGLAPGELAELHRAGVV
ncbi:MAG: CoA transferase [Chloroflexi bacterium]|nr:CoA transferase [Chloroflexota bacterium]